MAKNDKQLAMQVLENFDGLPMRQYLDRMTVKMQRGAIRSMIGKTGTLLAKEIRTQIKRRDMPYSRARNAAERKKARENNSKPLVRTIKTRSWNKTKAGLFGVIVGPAYVGGRHGHLAEFGHRIRGHARITFKGLSLKALRRGRLRRKVVKLGRRSISRSGQRTIAHEFQQHAMLISEAKILATMEKALSRFIRSQGTRKIK